MSGKKDRYGERERCPIHGHTRRLSRSEIAEIIHSIDIANSKAKREGFKPQKPQIILFSCKCNCFYINVKI